MTGERFIPFRRTSIVTMCADEVPAEERESFQAFTELLASLIHQEFRSRLEALKDAYDPFNPDTDTRTIVELSPAERQAAEVRLVEELTALAEDANFERISTDDLGHAFVEFHTRNGLTMPGADIHTPAHYVSHDMNHVIAGYEPTGPGEIALGAFTLAMCDNDANWIQFIASLSIHEAGIVQHGEIMPKASTLSRPGATDLLADAFQRGAQCTSDFSQAEHLTMVDWPLADVRAHFGVPAADRLGLGM